MNESEDKIIVFDSYDTVMAANLVKTKLDAYGIPCFLSDENFVGLYPIRNELFPGVRLHIFEKDQERVKEILGEHHDVEAEILPCPVCGSTNLVMEPGRKGLIPTIIASLLLGLFIPTKKKYRCQDCQRDFDSIPERPKSSI